MIKVTVSFSESVLARSLRGNICRREKGGGMNVLYVAFQSVIFGFASANLKTVRKELREGRRMRLTLTLLITCCLGIRDNLIIQFCG